MYKKTKGKNKNKEICNCDNKAQTKTQQIIL